MKRNGREFTPWHRPVQKIELSENHIKPRGILALLCLIVGMGFLGYALLSALNTEPTWQEISVTGTEPNCGSSFQLMYDFSPDEGNATVQQKALTTLYSQAAVDGYRIFSPDYLAEGFGNVACLNAHVNEPVNLHPALYKALEQVNAAENRQIFLAPAAEQYRHVFTSHTDGEAAQYDPAKNDQTAQWFSALAGYVSDPNAVEVILYGENRAMLSVSEEYLQFARENEIERFLDFGWMTNAFLADFLAESLAEKGFLHGYLSSADGFTRNLDTRGNAYTVNLLTGQGGEPVSPGQMQYTSPISLVLLRRFSLEAGDCYTYASGQVVTAYLDPQDCRSKAAADSLLAYSETTGCGQLLLQMAPLYTAESLDTQSLCALRERGTYAIWCQDKTVFYNDSALSLSTGNGFVANFIN